MTQHDPLLLQIPAKLGYRLPAEWEPHAATWIAWPHHREDWPDRFGPIPWVYVNFVRQLSRFEFVRILVQGPKAERKAADRLDRAGVDLSRVGFVRAGTNRSWTRDYLPSFIVADSAANETDRVALVPWAFNAWAKYENFQHDADISRIVSRTLGLQRFVPRRREGDTWRTVVLEGGAIDSNGCGTLLATEECLLDKIQARNPSLSREQLEQVLSDYLGVRRVVWLGKGIVGDDTHGHVDDITRFVDPRTVVTVVEHNLQDPNYHILQDNLERLRESRDQDARPLNIVTLPMPRPVIFQGQKLPASYANFYIANGAVFVPTFNDPADRSALITLEALFPGREVIGIHALDLVWGFGTLHCMTHEQPAGSTVHV